jgi:hypothetical protein
MRVTRISASPLALFTGAAMNAGLSHKATFALTEALTALLLAAGIVVCLRFVAGKDGAAAALVVLAFALLPNQGLHYLVPSVLVLALALVLWTLALQGARAWLMAILAIVMLLVHPIGPVYVLVAVVLVAGRALLTRRAARRDIVCLAAVALSVPLWFAIQSFSGAREPATAGLGGLSFSNVPQNVAGLARHLRTLALTQGPLLLLTIAGIVHACRHRRERPEAWVLVGVLSGVVLSTVIVDIPGYPGELPSRALVALVIVAGGVGAAWALRMARERAIRRRWIAGVLAVVVAAQLPLWFREGLANVNSRHQVYDPAQLRSEIRAVKRDAVIVWVDSDLALMAGLLEGADRVRAVPYSMLASPADLRKNTAGASEIWIATTSPERLNGLASIGSWSLKPRYLGHGFDSYRRLSFDAPMADAMPRHIRLDGGGPHDLKVSGGNGQACRLVPSRAPQAGWFRLEACEDQVILHLESDVRTLRIVGASVAAPDPAKPWPWSNQELRLQMEPRRGGREEMMFSFAYLMGATTAQVIESELGPLSLAGSRSGIVWLRGTPTASNP